MAHSSWQNLRSPSFAERLVIYLIRAAIITDNRYELSVRRFLRNPFSRNIACYIQTLEFDDSDYFTFEKNAFLIQLGGPCAPLTKEQIESDRQALKREVRARTILKSHAQ